jgi:hypothetical protein
MLYAVTFLGPFTVLVFNALLIASNGTDSHVGSFTADWERFFEVLPHGHGSEVVDATHGSR